MSKEDDTRARLLRLVWEEIRGLNTENVRNYPAAARAIAAGALADDVITAMTAASYETAFRLLFLFSAEHVEDGAYEAKFGWTLAETRLQNGAVVPTGSDVLDFVHEDLLGFDPSGCEGQDLFT